MQRLTAEELVGRELDKQRYDDLRQNPYLPYFVAGELTEREADINLHITAVIVRRKLRRQEPYQTPVKLETFLNVRDAVVGDIETGVHMYAVSEGLYYLARDTGTSPQTVEKIVKTEADLRNLIADPSIVPNLPWHPRNIQLSVTDGEALLDFLRKRYEKRPDQFFGRYGNRAGSFYVAEDFDPFSAEDVFLNRIGSLIGPGDSASRLTEIDDERFASHWKQNTLLLRYSEASKIKQELRKLYERDKDAFYRVFGGLVGGLAFPQFLKKNGILCSAYQAATLLRSPEKAAAFLEIDGTEMRDRWTLISPNGFTSRSYQSPRLLAYVRDLFAEDPDRFFSDYYFNEIGAVELGRAYRKTSGENVNLSQVSSILTNGPSLATILKSDDPRLRKKAAVVRVDQTLSDVEKVLRFCRQAYRDDPDRFFERYGGAMGVSNLEEDIANEGVTVSRKQDPIQLSRLTKRGDTFSRLLGVSDPWFETAWNQRHHTLNQGQREQVYAFLQLKYREDPDGFFDRYGSATGIVHLEDDLEAAGIRLAANRLSHLFYRGEIVQDAVGANDARFETAWKPRNIQTNKADREAALASLTKAYQDDRLRFFARYGGSAGPYLLQQDIKAATGRSIPLCQLGSLTHNPTILAELSGIPAEDLERDWHPTAQYLSERQIAHLQRYLRQMYEASPASFFDLFSGPQGQLVLLNRFKADGKKLPNPHALQYALKSRDFVSLLVESDDPSFASWSPPVLTGSVRGFETALDALRESYAADRDGFRRTYGSPAGAVNLAREVARRGVRNPGIRDAFSLIASPATVEAVLGVRDPGIAAAWEPVNMHFNLQNVEATRAHLLGLYEEDQDAFFLRYGSRIRGAAMLKEMGDKGVEKALNFHGEVMRHGRTTEALLGVENGRFETDWQKRMWAGTMSGLPYRDAVGLIAEGFGDLAADPSLPDRPDQRPASYMEVRRMLRTSSLANAHYLAELYVPKLARKARGVLDKVVDQDRRTLRDVETIRDVADVARYGESRFVGTVGRLLYSPDDEVRRGAQAQLLRLFGEPVSRMRMVQENPDLWDAFSDHCLNFDLYRLRADGTDGRQQSFGDHARNFIYINEFYLSLKGKSGVSLDQPLGDEDDRTVHEVIG